MYAPVLVTPPAITPVSLAEAKAHLRVGHSDEDALITSLIEAAVSHLDGWSGMLGRALVEQTWKQEYDAFARCLRLPLFPVISIESVTWRNEDGQISTVADTNYLLRTDELGAFARFDDGFAFPAGLHESAAVAVTYVAGYPTIEADPDAVPPIEETTSTVPAAIKSAILLMVGHWYRFRSAGAEVSVQEVPMSAQALISQFRRSIA